MSIRKALVYATFDGVLTAHSGIGTQTTTFLHEIAAHPAILTRHHIDDVFLAYPEACPNALGYEYDQHAWETAAGLLARGRAYAWALDWHAEVFWSAPAWHQMCRALAEHINTIAADYDEIIVLAVDAVFLRLADHLADHGHRVQLVHLWYSSVLISGMTANPNRLEAERWCIDQINRNPGNLHIADVGEYFTRHLREDFALTASPLPFPHSLSLSSPDYHRIPPERITALLGERGIPAEQPLVAYAGRVDPVKGLDILIEELRHVARPFRLIALTSPNYTEDPNFDAIVRQLETVDYPHTLISRFDRNLFRALCCAEQVRAIVCPSRGEPIGAVPQEAALLAAVAGPLVIASDRDGLAEQIIDGVTGLLFDPDTPGSLAAAITTALDAPTAHTRMVRQAAEQKVRSERDFGVCLDRMLTELHARTRAFDTPVPSPVVPI